MHYRVFICKPIYKESKTGLHLQQLRKIRKDTREVMETIPLKRTKGINYKGESLTESIRAERNESRTAYDIGLSEQINNPFHGEDIDKIISQFRLNPQTWLKEDFQGKNLLQRIIDRDMISKQRWAEIRFGLEPDELTERVPPKPNKENPDTRTRIMKKEVILYDEANPFCEDNLEGWLSIQILKHAKSRVANGMENINTAYHGWVIMEQAVEQRLSISNSMKVNKAIAKFSELSENYPVTNILEENILYFIGSLLLNNRFKPLLSGKVNPVTINEKLEGYLKPKSKSDTLPNIEKFNKIISLFEKTPDQFFAKYFAQQALNKNIIQQNNGVWFWKSQRDKTDNSGSYRFNSLEAFSNFIYNEMIAIESPLFEEFLRELKVKNTVIPIQFKVKE